METTRKQHLYNYIDHPTVNTYINWIDLILFYTLVTHATIELQRSIHTF